LLTSILALPQNSIMHYGKSYFAKTKGKPTLTARMPGVAKLGQRKALSQTDCLKVNDLYGCLDADNPKLMRKYYTLCRVLGV
jgi:Astacin (Peptidase family M12A)